MCILKKTGYEIVPPQKHLCSYDECRDVSATTELENKQNIQRCLRHCYLAVVPAMR